MAQEINLIVNNHSYTVSVLPGEKLVHLLRERLGLIGTKVGCGEGRCGSCTVLLNGNPVRSCVFPAEKADGKEIYTIEGVTGSAEDEGELHPLQTAFVTYGAVQCGFCTPGLIMSAYSLLKKNPSPTSDEIRQALRRNLCRCAGYPSIEAAIQAAAKSLQTGEPLKPFEIKTADQSMSVIGKTVIRPDAVDKVTGRALFTDDLTFEGMLFARVKRAHVPHAILRRLSLSKAQALPGVIAVLTAEDIPGEHNHGLVIPDWPALVGVGERVRYVGDAVAILAATTQNIADKAVELIEAEYEPLPILTDPIQALAPDAPQLHKQGNLLKHIKVRKGDVAKGFNQASLTLDHTYHTPTMEHAFMEPECSIAVPNDEGRMEVYVGSQIPYADRDQVAKVLDMPKEDVRIIGQLVGGGFGGKEDIAGQIHSALLAQASGKPVKLLFDRRESMLVHPKRHATQIKIKAGVDDEGRLTAVETLLYGDTGAYASLGEEVMTRATTHSAGPYQIPHTKADCYAVYTNNPPAGAYRGFGVLQSIFAIESMMDELAHQLKVNPFTFRRMNALTEGSRTNTNQKLRSSVGLIECLDKVEEKLRKIAGEDPFEPIYYTRDDQKFVSAWGVAAAFKNTGLGSGALDMSQAEVELFADGTLEVRTSAAEIGQGLVTVLRMIVAEEMMVAPENVHVLVMDTDLTPDGGPTTASRQTYVTGNAARLAAQSLRIHIKAFLAEAYDVTPKQIHFKDGKVHLGEDQLTLKAVAKEMIAGGYTLKVCYEYTAPETQPLGEDGDIHFAFSFAAQATQIEVNLETGKLRVLKVITANDAGRVINPLGFKGQVEGGVMMGISHALMEEFIVEEGEVITDRMARYSIPSIQDTPEIFPFVVEHPTQEGPYGAKGIGEIVSIPTPPAIANALYNAIGLRVDRLPIKTETVRNALEK